MSPERPLKDVGASVRQRLYNRSRERGEDFGWVLSRYAIERILYRLSCSEHANQLILKGAQLFAVWVESPYRASRDLDLLRRGDSSIERLEGIFRSLCSQPVGIPDGIVFAAETVRGEEIREDTEYGGVRVHLLCRLAGARENLQVDIGVGDPVTPAPVRVEYPSLLNLPAPVLLAYPRETVVAEKLEVMIRRGIANSRMKDYFDLYVLSRDFAFDGQPFVDAVRATLAGRETPIPAQVPVALTAAFGSDPAKELQWQGFLRRSRVAVTPPGLGLVVEALNQFLMPPLAALAAGVPFAESWPPGGPWQAHGAAPVP